MRFSRWRNPKTWLLLTPLYVRTHETVTWCPCIHRILFLLWICTKIEAWVDQPLSALYHCCSSNRPSLVDCNTCQRQIFEISCLWGIFCQAQSLPYDMLGHPSLNFQSQQLILVSRTMCCDESAERVEPLDSTKCSLWSDECSLTLTPSTSLAASYPRSPTAVLVEVCAIFVSCWIETFG